MPFPAATPWPNESSSGLRTASLPEHPACFQNVAQHRIRVPQDDLLLRQWFGNLARDRQRMKQVLDVLFLSVLLID